MRFSTALVLLSSAAFAVAQTSTQSAAGASSTCAAENIVQACLDQEQVKVNACSQTDYVCLCQAYQQLATCYNNCPGDAGKATVDSEVTAWCTAAAPILSASSASVASAASTAGTAASTNNAASATLATGTASGTATRSATGSATNASATGAANVVFAPIGGILALVLGVMGLF